MSFRCISTTGKGFFLRTATLCIACSIFVPIARSNDVRTYHGIDGDTVRASFVSLSGNRVTLRREDGKTFNLSTAHLSASDRSYIQQSDLKIRSIVKTLNRAAGHDLTDASPFSERRAQDLVKALKLRPESKSKYGHSWRLYAASSGSYRLFGTMPYSVALYSDSSGRPSHLSIVYANKGDFGSTAGSGENHFKGGTTATAATLAEAMDRDEETITQSLTSVLGEGKTERYGEGDTRRRITRWDWNGHSFLLSNEKGEYVGLSVVSTESASSGGKSARVKDSEVKQRLLDSIVKADNGDIYLSEIPMVNQGPKGYCVPATFERAMRTMGLEADMYLLAMVGQSQAGGGTSVQLLLQNVRSQVYRKGRRTKDDRLKTLRIRDLRRYIDQGIPVMWTMHSVATYNKTANQNTARRRKTQDWKSYTDEITLRADEITDTPKPDDKNHICMIIGYNESTNEIAVSDSWGPSFEKRWIPVAVADWASQGGIFMILP